MVEPSPPPSSLSIPPQWHWHLRTLQTLRDSLGGSLAEVGRSFRLPAERGGEDLADVANERVTRAVLLAEFSGQERALVEIEAALARLYRGTYGICEDTGLPIEPARLRALPWTRYCLEAATRREKGPRPGA